MSVETDLYALLTADAGVQAALAASLAAAGDEIGDRFAADRIEQDTTRPFAVFTRTSTEKQEGLDGTVFAERVVLELQVWADKRLDADALADVCQAALDEAGHSVTGRASGFDGELGLEATVLTVEWWA